MVIDVGGATTDVSLLPMGILLSGRCSKGLPSHMKKERLRGIWALDIMHSLYWI